MLVLRKELHECRVRDAQNRILGALVRLSRSAFTAEIEYAGPAFEKAYDLLRANLQLLRDFGRREVFRQCRFLFNYYRWFWFSWLLSCTHSCLRTLESCCIQSVPLSGLVRPQ